MLNVEWRMQNVDVECGSEVGFLHSAFGILHFQPGRRTG